jgi:hypothetical protein
VSTSADHAAPRGLAEKLGIQPGAVVQVVGVGDDVDQDLIADVQARTGTELITTDDSDDVVDVILLWWREDDGDLVDALVDSLTNLADSGVVWLLTPKAGRDGHVEPSDIDEAAPTAGPVQHPQHQRRPGVVGHAPGLAQGGEEQVPALTPEQARRLLSDAGRAAVAHAASLDLSTPARIRTLELLRADVGVELAPLALEQALLRRRALAKHPRGDELWWTPDALEQSSSAVVAAWRARRYQDPVLDLCCSVGGDLLALPAGSVGVDLDEARLLLARANASALGRRVQLVRADVTTLALPPSADVFVDPARRSGGRRTFDPGRTRRRWTPCSAGGRGCGGSG